MPGVADGSNDLSSLPGGPVSLCLSLEGRLSESHLGRVFLRQKPFLISARRWSMMQPSSGGGRPLLTGVERESREVMKHILYSNYQKYLFN